MKCAGTCKAPGRPLSAILYLMQGDSLGSQCHLSFEVTMCPSFTGFAVSESLACCAGLRWMRHGISTTVGLSSPVQKVEAPASRSSSWTLRCLRFSGVFLVAKPLRCQVTVELLATPSVLEDLGSQKALAR